MHNFINLIKTIEDARLANSLKESKEMLNDMLNTKILSKATKDLTKEIKLSLNSLYVHHKRDQVIPNANNEGANDEHFVTEEGTPIPIRNEVTSMRHAIFNKLSNQV